MITDQNKSPNWDEYSEVSSEELKNIWENNYGCTFNEPWPQEYCGVVFEIRTKNGDIIDAKIDDSCICTSGELKWESFNQEIIAKRHVACWREKVENSINPKQF